LGELLHLAAGVVRCCTHLDDLEGPVAGRRQNCPGSGGGDAPAILVAQRTSSVEKWHGSLTRNGIRPERNDSNARAAAPVARTINAGWVGAMVFCGGKASGGEVRLYRKHMQFPPQHMRAPLLWLKTFPLDQRS
jgi:hypothetical protein